MSTIAFRQLATDTQHFVGKGTGSRDMRIKIKRVGTGAETENIDSSTGLKVTADGLAVDFTYAATSASVALVATNLAQEILDRAADVDAEEARAIAAEAVLSAAISAETTARIADVNAEESRALAAEAALGLRVDDVETDLTAEIAARIADVNAEETRALAAEAVLSAAISAETTARIADVDAEETRALAAEAVLSASIATETTARIADVDAEEARALAAEAVLSAAITAETAARIVDVNAEESRAMAEEADIRVDFAAADTTLQSNIDSLESYFQGQLEGLSWKNAVKLAFSTSINITSGPAALQQDFNLSVDDRVLLMGQSPATENGLYLYKGEGVAMVRTLDADEGSPEMELDGAAVLVLEGDLSNKKYTQTTSPVTLGTSNIVWVQFGGGAELTEGNGIDINGNVVNVRPHDQVVAAATHAPVYSGADGVAVKVDGTSIKHSSGQLYIESVSASTLSFTARRREVGLTYVSENSRWEGSLSTTALADSSLVEMRELFRNGVAEFEQVMTIGELAAGKFCIVSNALFVGGAAGDFTGDTFKLFYHVASA